MEELTTLSLGSPANTPRYFKESSKDIHVKAKRGIVSCRGLKNRTLHDSHVNKISMTPNQQQFCLATVDGIEIIQNDASSSSLKRELFRTKSAVSIVKPLADSSKFAVVLEEEPNTVVLCNQQDQQLKTNIEFESKIVEIVCTEEFLVIVLFRTTYVFRIDGLRCIDQIATCRNKEGLCGVSSLPRPKNKIIASPAPNVGEIIVQEYDLGQSVTHKIKAHQSKLSALAVNPMGTLVASSSVTGTLIRIFSAEDGSVLQELRRGSSQANINNLIFHPTLNILACSSDKTTIHLFEIKDSVEKCVKSNEYGFCRKETSTVNVTTFDNKKSCFKFLNFLSNFFNSEWSVTKIKVQNGDKVCGFDTKNNSLAIITRGKEATFCLYYIRIPDSSCRYMEDARIIKL